MGEKATRDAYGEALARLGEEREDIVVLDADLSKSTKTAKFAERFPERFFNMGIAEQNLMGTAAGLALAGKIPFCSTFAVFASGRALDQVRNSIAYPRLNVKIVATHAGITVGEDGASHQSVEDIALMRSIPGMTVIVPADAVETEKAVWAIAAMEGPVYMRLGRGSVPVVHGADYQFQLGKAELMCPGQDATIAACGVMVAVALEAAEMLARERVQVRVLNLATIKPLDEEAVVTAAKETGAVVTAEEHNIIGGLGSAVAETLGEHFPVPLERVGIRDVFGQSGTPDQLMAHYGLRAVDLINAVKRVLRRKQ